MNVNPNICVVLYFLNRLMLEGWFCKEINTFFRTFKSTVLRFMYIYIFFLDLFSSSLYQIGFKSIQLGKVSTTNDPMFSHHFISLSDFLSYVFDINLLILLCAKASS